MNARGDFFKLTGWDSDYVDRRRRDAAVAGYRGPFPTPTSANALDTALGNLVAADHRASIVDADRLIVAWDVTQPVAVVAATDGEIDGLATWFLTIAAVAAEKSESGLLGHLIRVLVDEEPRHAVAAPAGDGDARSALEQALLHVSPANHVDEISKDDEVLFVADVSGVRHRDRVHASGLNTVSVSERTKNIVITGTNGKTSCVELGRQLGQAAIGPAASFGTLGVITERGRTRSPRMDLGPRALTNLTERLWQRGIDHVWTEGFSYALSAGLLDRFPVDVAGFTQMGMDHLNAHGSLVGYWRSKERLFETVLRPDGTVVIDPRVAGATRILDIAAQRSLDVVIVGTSESAVEVTAESVRMGDRTWPTTIPLVETVMHRNLEVTLGCCLALGAEPVDLVAAIPSLYGAPGRFFTLDIDSPFTLVVESAHNADALEATLGEWRRRSNGRILTLIASVGSADPMRWEPLGEVADVLADVVVVSDESPHRRDAKRIRDAMRRGCPRAADIADRSEAIRWLVDQAEPGDTIVLAGRADEDFLVDDQGAHPFPTDEALLIEALERRARRLGSDQPVG